jgi:microcin C transport system substrate-binding protein
VPAIAMYGEPKYGPDFAHFDYVNPDAPKGGTFTKANEAFLTFDTFNPFTLKGAAAYGLGFMHDTLMTGSLDEAMSYYSLVAATIEIAPDNSWVQFSLRPEAKFSDGAPITAADVVFSFDVLVSKGAPGYRIQFGDVAKAEALSPSLVRFTFKTNTNRELPLLLASLPVLSQAYWKDRDFAATTLDVPVTSGAYTIESFEVGRYVIYRRRDDYWAKDLPVNRGQNNFDRIRYEYFRDDTVQFEAFKSGGYDFMRNYSAGQWSRRFDFPAFLDGRVKKLEVSSKQPQDATGIVINLRRPLFQDRRVRQALNYAFDFESLNNNLFYQLYSRISSYWQGSDLQAEGVPTGPELALLEQFRDQVPPEVFTQPFVQPTTAGKGDARDNLIAARDLLREAGWTIVDGQLVNARGEPFAFEITIVQAGLDRVLLPWVQNLKRLGIDASIRLIDTSQYANRVNDYDYDAIYIGYSGSLTPGNELRAAWSSAFADRPGTPNYSGVKDPVVDALVDRVIQATEYDELVTASHALDRVLLWNHYRVLTYSSPVERYAFWDHLKQPAVTPAMGLGRMGEASISLWWADPGKPDVSAAAPGERETGEKSKAGAIVWVIAFAVIAAGILRLKRVRRS